MESFLLQDWTTINGQSGDQGYVIAQSEASWLDLEDYDDVIFYTDVRQLTGLPSLTFETSPVPEDASFAAIVPAFALVASTSPRTDVALATYTAVPLARFVRWKMTAIGGAFGATFRVFVAAYAPGR